MKSKAAIMRERSRARFTRKFTDQQVRTVIDAVMSGGSYKASGALVGMTSSSARYWFLKLAK